MSLELIIRPEAEADVLEAFHWYNEQVSGLGQQFLIELELERVLESIRESPEANRRIHRDFRRVLLRRFPYSAFYAIHERSVVVIAALHAARDPRLMKKRARNAR